MCYSSYQDFLGFAGELFGNLRAACIANIFYFEKATAAALASSACTYSVDQL